MYSAIFELILTLIGLAQNPNLTVAARQQALLSATQTLQVVFTQISSMNTKKASTTESTPQSNVPKLPPQGSTTPAPVQNVSIPVSTPEPVLQGISEPVSPYTVEGNSVPKSGGVFTFTVKKNGNPIEEIEKVSGNIINQIFLRLSEDLPPGRGQFHIYIPEQTKDIQDPSLNLELPGETVNVPISFTQ